MRLRTLRVIFIWTISIAAFIALSLFLAQRYLGPEVKRLFITEINKSLTAEVQIDDVQLSLIKDFPYASVRFSGVRMKEALTPPSKHYLFTAGTVSLRFNVWDLLRKKYKVKIIRLADVEVAPRVYPDGRDNFHFWKQSTGTSGNDLNFELERIILHNLHFRYLNDLTAVSTDATIPGFVASGNFSSSKYSLELAGTILLHNFKSKGTSYVSERNLNLKLTMDANNSTGLYSITEGTLETGKLKLSTYGSITYNDKQKHINLQVSATGSTLGEMISLIPTRYTKSIDGYKFEGKGDITSRISGAFGGNNMPAIQVSLTLNNGIIAERKSAISLQGVSAHAVYSVQQNGKNESLSVNNLKAKLGDGFLSGSFTMLGFTSPSIQCNINASLNLNELQQFIKYEHFTSLSGWMKINAAFDGRIADLEKLSASDFLNSNLSGSGSVQQARMGLKNYALPIENIQSVFDFTGNELTLRNLSFQAGRSDFNLKGSLSNLLSWIFIKNETLAITGNLVSKRFDWDQLSEAQQGSSGEYLFSLPADISVNNLQVQNNHFTFGKFTGKNISGFIQMRDKVLSAGDIDMLTCQGKVNGQFSINAKAEKYSLLQAKAHLEKVNIKTLFTQFGNFGQDDLKDENLEGTVTSDIIFAGTMQNNLDINLNSIKSHADIMIENGRLVNYSPMQSLSAFLKVEDLSDVRFATMRNQIDIANEIIFIPSMEIKSSALDLQLMGTHTFDNEIEYHFNIALADLVAAKYKKRNKIDKQAEFGPVEEDGRGRTKIYVSLTGTVDEPIVKYDKKAMREKIADDLKVQKAELKQILRQEFSRTIGDTIRKEKLTKERELIKKQEEGKFVIEWDDDKKEE